MARAMELVARGSAEAADVLALRRAKWCTVELRHLDGR